MSTGTIITTFVPNETKCIEYVFQLKQTHTMGLFITKVQGKILLGRPNIRSQSNETCALFLFGRHCIVIFFFL